MAVILSDKTTNGLLHTNECRSTIRSTLTDAHFLATMKLLNQFKSEKDAAKKTEIGHQISNVAFWAQWLIRGFLFEG
jgi:hypothetical protein